MSLFSRLHKTSLNHHHHHRHFSSILSPNSTTPLSSKQKSRAALSLLKTEQNPERILDICRSASLTPDSHLDRIAFSLAIQKLSQNHHFTTIHTLLHDLKTTRPDLKTERFISHSIVLYGQATMLDHAIAAFKELHDGTSSSSSIPCSIKSLNALLFACILAKDYKQVKTIYVEFPKIYKLEPNLDTFVTVIKAFCESGDSASCYSVLAEMDRKGVKPNATCFGTLLAGFYKEERYEDVGKVLNMMVDKYGMRPGVSVYNIRIQSLCKLKKSVEAKALFDGMCSRGMKPNSVTFCHLIHGFCKEGDLEEGKKLFKRMVNSGCQPDSDCYFTMVHYLCRGGDFETALRIYKESKEKGWVPNFSTMKSLVNGLASVSKVEEAKEIVGEMKEKFKNTVDMWNEVEVALPQ